MLPAFLSAILYVRVASGLTQQKKRTNRNRVLTLAFALSWLVWIICWAPNLALIAQMNYHDQQGDDYFYDYEPYDYEAIDYLYYNNKTINYSADYTLTRNQFLFYLIYLQAFRIPFQLLYSHLNPLLYLLVLKKFQEHHAKVFRWFLHLAFFKKNTQPAENSKPKLNLSKLMPKSFEAILFCLSLGLLVISITLCITSETSASMNLREQKMTNRDFQVIIKKLERNILNDLGFLKQEQSSLQIRTFCGEVGGTINIDYKRCFILSTHLPKYLNFTEHLQFCEATGTKMCYPRSQAEMKFMWGLVQSWGRDNMDIRVPPMYIDRYDSLEDVRAANHFSLDDVLKLYMIHVGFFKAEEKSFVSVDGKFEISSWSETWFYSWDWVSHQEVIRDFHGPAVCLGAATTTLWECRLTLKTPETFCCKDFFQ